jgi:acyl-CoA thioesterase-2
MLIESYGDRPPSRDAVDFLSRLRLQRVDRDVFTGWCHAGSPLRAFGGQVAAQALVAAGATVDDEGRALHSLHAYFLRPGRTTDHIVYMVERLRDGRSFSTRRVRAVQYGETIFAMSASFAVDQQGPTHQRDGDRDATPRWWDRLPGPQDIEPELVFDHVRIEDEEDGSDRPAALRAAGFPKRQLLDLRVIDPRRALELSGGEYDRMVWVRAVDDLGQDPLAHVCVMTYFSDLNLVGTVMGHHGGRAGTMQYEVASLDHAMWFHQPFRADDWLMFATDSPAAGAGHGFARGGFYRPDGVLASSAAQEVLVRVPPPRG